MTEAFDPSKHLRRLRGRGGDSEYLDVKWRLVWLRSEHPNARIETFLRDGGIEHNYAVFEARVSIPEGGSATGWGSETKGDFADFLEKAECCLTSTEILTRTGFKRHEALTVGEEVAAYDLTTDTLTWTPLRRVVVYDDASVVRLAGKRFEAVVTSNHSWATAAAYRSWVAGQPNRRLTETTHLRASDRIILAAPMPGGDSYLTPDEAAFLGWSLVDGTWNTRLSEDIDLPVLISHLSQPARAAMLEAMMDTDGGARGYFGKQRKPGVFEAWRVLCTLEGLAVGPLHDTKGFTVQRVKRQRFISCSELSVAYAGRASVWCPTTDYGTWVAKLPNGQITITGNTKALGRALAALGYGTQFAPELDDRDEAVVDAPRERPAAREPRPAESKRPTQPVEARGSDDGGAGRDRTQPVTENQVAFIHTLAREAGLDVVELDDWCAELFKQPLGALTYGQAQVLVRKLRERKEARS